VPFDQKAKGFGVSAAELFEEKSVGMDAKAKTDRGNEECKAHLCSA
jgi:hypothetical protein